MREMAKDILETQAETKRLEESKSRLKSELDQSKKQANELLSDVQGKQQDISDLEGSLRRRDKEICGLNVELKNLRARDVESEFR